MARPSALVIAAIPHEVEAFANEDDGRLREDIRTGVLVTLERFLQLVGTEEPALSEATAAVYARLGSEEAGERRGLESLLAAYRVGARLLFREMSMLATRAGADPHVLVDLGDAGHLNPAAGYGEWPLVDELVAELATARSRS